MVDNCLNADRCPFTCAKATGACICAETCSGWADPSRKGNAVATSSVKFSWIGDTMDENIRQILENQEVLLLGVSALLTPNCKGILDANGETHKNAMMIKCYHDTRKLLGKE